MSNAWPNSTNSFNFQKPFFFFLILEIVLQHLDVTPTEETRSFLTFVIPHDKERVLTVSNFENHILFLYSPNFFLQNFRFLFRYIHEHNNRLVGDHTFLYFTQVRTSLTFHFLWHLKSSTEIFCGASRETERIPCIRHSAWPCNSWRSFPKHCQASRIRKCCSRGEDGYSGLNFWKISSGRNNLSHFFVFHLCNRHKKIKPNLSA
jgi:hypothetical protein